MSQERLYWCERALDQLADAMSRCETLELLDMASQAYAIRDELEEIREELNKKPRKRPFDAKLSPHSRGTKVALRVIE